jgi:hypothetical protein
VYAFDATYDETGAARAERAFYVRSIMQLRPAMTFTPPVFFAVVVAAAVILQAPDWFTVSLSVGLVLAILGPLFFYIARPLGARRLARLYPVRKVKLTSNEFQVSAGEELTALPWGRFKHLWETEDYVLLVLGKFGAVSLPRKSLPEGAMQFIRSHIKSAA